MAGRGGFEPDSDANLDWTAGPPTCTLPGPMALYPLRTLHDLKPATTGWQAFVAGRIMAGTANDQQPRGY